MASKKGTRYASWLNIPKKIQKLHRENVMSIAIDYEKYVVSDTSIVMKMIREMGFSGEIDMDNSNIEHSPNYDLSLKHGKSDLGTYYEVSVNLPGFKPIQLFSCENYYSKRVSTLGAQGSIEFVGAFFRFKDILKEQAPDAVAFYDQVRRLSKFSDDNSSFPSIFRRNRVDVAFDIKNIPVDQKWEYEYIVPHKTSKRVPHHYNFVRELGGWQSFSYLPPNNRKIGLRIYNKVIDIKSKNKQSWYPDIDTEKDTVTRIELVVYSPFAENKDDTIMKSAQSMLLGIDTGVILCYVL